MNKKTIGIIIGVIVAVAGFLYLTQPAEKSNAEPTNHVKEGSSGVVLIEYGDFECPACGQYHPVLQVVKERYKGLVTFQFRHFPLESLHKNARAASRAAEAAAVQGKFWEMHDYLFENQQAWKTTNDPLGVFEGYARTVGVPDIEKFKADYRSSDINDRINADLDAGRALGAEATPTFVLDGKKLEENPAGTPDAFAAILDEAIRAKGGTPPTTNAAPNTTPVTGGPDPIPTEDTSAQ
jgi:protein-disulfide isomerase